MPAINYWAVLAAAASAFLLGGFWYSPAGFLKVWAKESGIDLETMEKQHKEESKHPAKVFGISFIWSLIAAFAFACWLGENPSLEQSLTFALTIGICWVAACYGINYQFASRSFKLFLVDAGYHASQFLLYGIIIGLWH